MDRPLERLSKCDWCGRTSCSIVLLECVDPPVPVCGFAANGRRDRGKVMLVAIESIFCLHQRPLCPMVGTLNLVAARVASYL